MKRLLVLCLALMAFVSWGRVEIQKSIYDTTYNFEVEKVDVSTTKVAGYDFSKLTLVGLDSYTGIHYERGLPEIPVVRFYVFADSKNDIQVFPQGDKSTEELHALPLELKPSQDSLPKIKGAKVPFVKFDLGKAIGFWPESEYSVSYAGSVRGKTKWLVTLYPVSYNPSMGSYKLLKNFEVKVLNPARVKNLEASKKDAIAFIVGKKFKNSPMVQKYATFKTQQGYVVKTLVFGEDATDDITLRKAIQDLYRQSDISLKFAFIIGDIEDVASHKAGALTLGVTDHFYRAIDTENYATDMNAPDIGVGRITPKNEEELTNTLEKFIKYQNGSFETEEWLKHPAFLATDDRYKIAEGSHNYVIDTYAAPAGYTGIFPANPQLGGDKLYAITYKVQKPTVLEALRQGRFMIDYSGHGATTYWDAPSVKQDDVRSFNGNGAYPFVIGNACITGQFTIPESFGETWIKNSAIMYWGSMDSSYWDEDDVLERSMANKVFGEGVREFGEFTNYALGEVWKFYNGANRSKYYWETYVTFGDPSIHLRTKPSKTISIDGMTTLPLGESTVEYRVFNQDGSPVVNARVTLSLGNKLISSKMTNSNGSVTLQVSDVDVGDKLVLNVYADDARFESKEVLITSTTSAYLVVGNFTANGVSSSELRPFENVRINFLIKNVARVPTKGAKITLESIEGPAEVISNQANIPAIAAGEVYSYQGSDILIRMLDASLCDKVTLKFRWTTAEGDTKLFNQSYKIKRGQLSVTAVDFGDINNPGDGGFGPGQEGEIFVTLKNTGNDQIFNAKLLAETNSCLDAIYGEITVPVLNPGESVRIAKPLSAKVSSICQNDQTAMFSLRGTYQGLAQLDLKADGQFLIGSYGNFEYSNPALDLAIPDSGEVAFSFDVNNIDILKQITLNAKITHSFIGDLVVELVAPDGTTTTLRSREGGGDDFLELNLEPNFEAFKKLYGKKASGTWQLIFRDGASTDEGKVDSVSIKLRGFI